MELSLIKKFTELRQSSGIPCLPEEGVPTEKVLAMVSAKSSVAAKNYTDGGNITGAVYTKDESHWEFIS
jgi:hypothetical protein